MGVKIWNVELSFFSWSLLNYWVIILFRDAHEASL